MNDKGGEGKREEGCSQVHGRVWGLFIVASAKVQYKSPGYSVNTTVYNICTLFWEDSCESWKQLKDFKPGSDVIELCFGLLALMESEFNHDKIGNRETG